MKIFTERKIVPVKYKGYVRGVADISLPTLSPPEIVSNGDTDGDTVSEELILFVNDFYAQIFECYRTLFINTTKSWCESDGARHCGVRDVTMTVSFSFADEELFKKRRWRKRNKEKILAIKRIATLTFHGEKKYHFESMDVFDTECVALIK